MTKSHLSKGMRRHIRKEKARKKKEEGLKLQSTYKLPNYYDFPKAIREERGNRFQGYITYYYCSNCGSYHFRDISIQTIQGTKTIHVCQLCKTKFRLKN